MGIILIIQFGRKSSCSVETGVWIQQSLLRKCLDCIRVFYAHLKPYQDSSWILKSEFAKHHLAEKRRGRSCTKKWIVLNAVTSLRLVNIHGHALVHLISQFILVLGVC